MSKLDRNTLKSYFQAGKIPTEQQFADFIDSVPNCVDDHLLEAPAQQVGSATTDGIQQLVFKSSAEAPVAWTLTLHPDQHLLLTNKEGEVVAEFMQDKSVRIFGDVVRANEKTAVGEPQGESEVSSIPDEERAEEPDTFEEPLNIADSLVEGCVGPMTSETSQMSTRYSASEPTVLDCPVADSPASAPQVEEPLSAPQTEDVQYADAQVDPICRNAYIFPADAEWYVIPRKFADDAVVKISISFTENGLSFGHETLATLHPVDGHLTVTVMPQLTFQQSADEIDVRWCEETKTLQMRSRRFVSVGEVRCSIYDGEK